MAFIEPNDSVLNEQFSAAEGQSENAGNTTRDENPASLSDALNADNLVPENAKDTVEDPVDSNSEAKETEEEFEPTLQSEVSAEEATGVDYFKMDKLELIQALQLLLTSKPLQQIGDDADIIKINFNDNTRNSLTIRIKKTNWLCSKGNIKHDILTTFVIDRTIDFSSTPPRRHSYS